MEYKKTKVAHDTVRRMMTDGIGIMFLGSVHQQAFKQITKIDVDNFLDDVASQDGGIQNKAYCNMKGVLKQTFEYAIDADYIDRIHTGTRLIRKDNSYQKKDSKRKSLTEQEQ